MKLCKRISYLLLWTISFTLQRCLWAQKVEVLSQVTGYVGHNVTLPCRFIQGTRYSNVTQSQWDFLSPHGNKTLITVFNKQHGKSVPESHLKGRVDMDDQLLQIKNVELSDAGSYICTINNFPLGTFESTTKLHVQELKPMPSWYIYVIASSLLLLLLILSVTAYFFSRRFECTKRGHEHEQGNARICETDLTSTAGKEEVVYAGVKIKKPKKASSSKTKHEDSAHSDYVIYSHVNVSHQQN